MPGTDVYCVALHMINGEHTVSDVGVAASDSKKPSSHMVTLPHTRSVVALGSTTVYSAGALHVLTGAHSASPAGWQGTSWYVPSGHTRHGEHSVSAAAPHACTANDPAAHAEQSEQTVSAVLLQTTETN